jgi:DNA-binding transcriptional MerR regulator
MAELTIGRLADEAGVNVETIRYYQRRGLMAEPDKPINGHRRYAADAVKRVRFIKKAQVLGSPSKRSAASLNSMRPMPVPRRADLPRTSWRSSRTNSPT